MSYVWTGAKEMTPEQAVAHLRRSVVGVDWQAVQVLNGEVGRLRSAITEVIPRIESQAAISARPGQLDALESIAARLRETLGEKPASS